MIRKLTLLLILIPIFILIKYFSLQEKFYCNECNVVLISVDTLRADHMGTYGYSKKTTPNIDSWAKKSVQFEKMYTVFPLTPHSFYTLFSGNYSVLKESTLQTSYPIVMNNYLHINIDTLQKKLKENGYFNAAYITNPLVGVLFKNFQVNFDSFEFINTSKFADNDPRVYNYTYNDQRELTNRAINFLNNYSGKKFFLWLHYLNPHHPYNPKKEYICKISPNCKNTTKSKLDPDDNPSSCLRYLSSSEIENEKALYDGEIASTDEQIGRILKEIEKGKNHLSKKTIVVFYADHGEGFDHNIFHHGNALYESSVRIPFIVSLPGQPAKKITALMDNSTIMTGIIDYLGITGSTESLLRNVIDGKNEKRKDFVYFMTPINKTDRKGVTDGRYKYIESTNDYCLLNGYSSELYDLQNDPQELNNLADKNVEMANSLRKKLNDFFANPNGSKSAEMKIEDEKIIESLKNIGY